MRYIAMLLAVVLLLSSVAFATTAPGPESSDTSPGLPGETRAEGEPPESGTEAPASEPTASEPTTAEPPPVQEITVTAELPQDFQAYLLFGIGIVAGGLAALGFIRGTKM